MVPVLIRSFAKGGYDPSLVNLDSPIDLPQLSFRASLLTRTKTYEAA